MASLPSISPEKVYENNEEPRLQAALALYDDEKWEEAALSLGPIANDGNLLAIFKYANTLENLGEHVAAEHYWQVAVSAGDGNSANNLANLKKRQGRDHEVTALYELAVELGCVDALRNLGIWIQDEYPERAERLFREAIESQVSGACANLAQLLFEQDRESEAMEWLEMGISRGEFYSAGLLVVHFFQREDYEAVVKAVQDNHSIWHSHSFDNPAHPFKLLVLSLLYLGRTDEASEVLEECGEVGVPELESLHKMLLEIATADDSYIRGANTARQRDKTGFNDPYSRKGT